MKRAVVAKTICGVPGCDRPTDGFVCADCAADYLKDLKQARWLVDQLDTALAKQTHYGAASGGRVVGKAMPLPVDLRAGKALDDYRAALVAAVRALQPNRDHWPAVLVDRSATDERVVVACARWLTVRANAVRWIPAGADVVAAQDRAFKSALWAVNSPAGRWFAGPCMYGQPPCPAYLYAEVGADVVTCSACGETFDVSVRREYLRQEAEDQLVNATDLARAVTWLGDRHLTADRVYQWARRKRIVAKAITRCSAHLKDVSPPPCRKCQPLYRVGDAIDLLAAERAPGGAA